MESTGIVDICKNSPSKGYVVGTLRSNDDTTILANCKHQSFTNTKGKLLPTVCEPTFLEDPTHRNKAVSKYF